MSVNKESVRKAGIVIITILIIVVANILILYKCGVFELYDLKKTYNEALNEGSTIRIYKSGDTITAVLDENNDTAEEVDISNKELDEYIESIKDNERKDLMKDYFFLPSVPQYRIQKISDLTLMERAKYLAEMPEYAKILTPEMQDRMCKAAPLHDIGKIKISDVVLNKPGRLTEDEFEVIKTHTLSGGEIIEKTLTDIESDSYLKVAQEMALYHHEKWDGSGYPYHLSGEEIPLCARIMAVVDVFDALTSKRVYKEAFPVEKAFRILEESSGTHFDPKIVGTFLAHKEEVRQVLTKYQDRHI